MSNYSIEVKNLTKKFGDFTAVDNISFTVEKGSIFAFLGPNGAGKSTTINILCTILEKTAGEIFLNDKDISTDKDGVRSEIGIVFQESTLDGKLTIEENLRLHCDFYNVPQSEVSSRIDSVLELVDLVQWRHVLVDGLSGGMKRRTEIARGLIHYPKVLFLDEPTTGLDPQTRANVWEYIKRLQKEHNITIFLTTHYMDEAEICDKVAIIDHGRITVHDTPYNLKRKYSNTTMKLSTRNKSTLLQYLAAADIPYKETNDYFLISIKETAKIVKVVSDLQSIIEDIEITKGTMNDVFITITGKEIRE
jgi:ABC-2 type transport system ATP-binding protein